MKNMGKTLLSLLLAAVMLCQTACSGGETAVTDGENTPVSSSVSQSGNMAINELRPDRKLDDDAKDVDGIALSSAEDLAKIGNDKNILSTGIMSLSRILICQITALLLR